MKLSTKGRYALTIMINLGREYKSSRFVSLSEIALRENISLKYLEKIMSDLKKADFFEVCMGKDGGYRLKREPSSYTIGDIIRASKEDLVVVDCLSNELCPKKSSCGTFSLWDGLSLEINKYLDSKKLSEYI